jgi:hypothetical protein
MSVDFDDAASSAELTLRAVKMDGADRPSVRVVCRELGVRLELVAPHVIRGGHHARYVGLGDRIVRRRGLPPWLDAWALAHELGHRALGRRVVEDVEGWCDAFAGAMLVPAAGLFDRWRRSRDLTKLMATYPDVAPTCLALRVGETRLADVIVVQGRSLRYVRAANDVPSALTLGLEAMARGHASQDGVTAWRMADAPRRAAVVAEAA